jgi:aminopeptidase 2
MIPLSLLSVGKDDKPKIQKELVLDSREIEIELDTSKPFKLNAGTVSPSLCFSVFTDGFHTE